MLKTILFRLFSGIYRFRILIYFIIISIILTFSVLSRNGFPFRYDWAWPFFDLTQFWNGITGQSSFGIFSALSQTGPALFGLFGLVHFPPSLFFKIFIIAVHSLAGYGFYLFIKSRVKSEIIAIVSGIAYAFSPYIFIRTIVGFTWSMVAYAVLPIFLLKVWQPKIKILDYLIIGFLFSLIFGQTQTGILTFFIITVYTIIGLFNTERIKFIKNYFLVVLSLLILTLPWLAVLLLKNKNASVVSGSAVTTLERMSSLPHSFRNMIMLSDHEITVLFFYPLSHDKLMMAGFGIIWLVALCSLCNKKNRQLVLTFFISSMLAIPFYKGPVGHFGSFYLWFYAHFPQIMIFRETYHFEFLFAISLVVLFAFGLDFLWQRIDSFKTTNHQLPTTNLIKTGLKTLFAGSALFIIVPYLTFDYAGYLKLQKIPTEYTQLYDYFQDNKDVCQKIYYPPGLDFVFFKGDKLPGASNSDSIAGSIGIPYVSGGTSILNTPSEEMFYQNELISQFYEKSDNGEFASLLSEGGVDCVVVRQDMDTKYDQAMNLKFEKDSTLIKHWNQNDWLSMTKSKKGMVEEKSFGNSIFVYKVDSTTKLPIDRNYEITNKVGNPTIEQFNPSTALRAGEPTIVSLRLTDWANVNSYYKNGWSRGRYDFWRKHLFTQLRQDFIYTDKLDSVLTGKIDQKGDYEVWSRLLIGGNSGELEVKIQDTRYKIQKDPGVEKFVWKKLGDIKLDSKTDIGIKNITGENAIVDIILVSR